MHCGLDQSSDQAASKQSLRRDGVEDLVLRGLDVHLHYSRRYPSLYVSVFQPWLADRLDLSR
jgi:hypothetical protein